MEPTLVAGALAADYWRVSRKTWLPAVLRPHVMTCNPNAKVQEADQAPEHLPRRQRRHLD